MSKISIGFVGVVFLALSLATNIQAVEPSSSPSTQAPEAGAATVEGFCFIGESSTNLKPGPCVNLLLILNDDKGVEVEKARTTSQGMFEFSAEIGKIYHIVSGSKLFEVANPKSVRGGSKINLQLQQK